VKYIDTDVPLTQLGPPEIIDIEPIQTCNLRCLQCHVSYEPLSHTRLDPAFLKNLKGIENRWVLLGGEYEPFAHPKIGDIISGLSQLGVKIEVTTNGTLFTPRLEAQIEDAKWANVVISFDGATKKTFESIRRNANFDKTIESIINFKTAVQTHQGRDVTFSINYTILRRNIAEIPQAVGLWEGLGFDHIGFIAMVIRNSNETLEKESPEPVMDQVYEQLDIAARNVIKNNSRITLTSAGYLNRWSEVKDELPVNFMNSLVVSNHPETRTPFNPRTYFQNGAFPGMHVNCRSPFKYVRILYNGDVELCFQFTIGSIYENNILDIWYGKKAQDVRELVTKNPAVCYACDYYKFCIKAEGVDYSNQDNHHNESMVSQFAKPLFIQELGAFQIVGYQNAFYSFPKIMGHLDPRFFDRVNEDKKIFRADTIIDLKDKIRKFFENNELELLESITSSLFVQVFGKYNIMAWWDGYIGIPKAYGPVKINKPGDLDTKGIFFELSLEKLKYEIEKFSETFELPDKTPESVEFKQHNISYWRGSYLGIPHALGTIDLESGNLDKLAGSLIGSNLNAVKEKISQKVLAEEERQNIFKNLKIVPYRKHNTFHLFSEFFAVPQALGFVDLQSDELKQIKGILTADSQRELEKKIDQQILVEEERHRAAQNLQIVTYKGHNTFHLLSQFFAVPQALGAFDPLSDELEHLPGVLTAGNQKEIENKIDLKIIAQEERHRAAQNLQIVAYKEYNTFELGSESFAIPQALGAFDPLSDTLKQLEGILTADSPNELKEKIDQEIIEKQEQQRSTYNLKIIAYKEHNTFQLGSRFIAVPQVLGAFDPHSAELGNLPGVLTADSQNDLEKKIDQKISAKEKLRRAAQNLKIVSYKEYNTFNIGSEFLAVPQALGAFDPLSDELGSLAGVLTAGNQKELENKIDQKIVAQEERRHAVENLKIVVYKGHNTFQLVAEFYAVPQALGFVDLLSDDLKQIKGILTAPSQNELEKKIDQKISAKLEQLCTTVTMKIIAYKGYNTFSIDSKVFAIPQALGAFDPHSDELENLPGVLTADTLAKLEIKINQKILAEEEQKRIVRDINIIAYKGHNTFCLGDKYYAVPQALGAFDPHSDDLKNLPGVLTADNQKEIEDKIDQKIAKEEERRRAAANLKIIAYKEHNTFCLGDKYFAVPQALGAFDPNSYELENLPGVLTAGNKKELENKIDQKIAREEERRRAAKNLQIVAYKGHNIFNLFSESFAVPQALGAFDPFSDDLKNFPGILTANNQKKLKKLIDQKIAKEEVRRHNAENFKIVPYESYNTFSLGKQIFAVPQALGAFDPFSDDLKTLPGILIAASQKDIEKQIDQQLVAKQQDSSKNGTSVKDEQQSIPKNPNIIVYKGYYTLRQNSKYLAIPQILGTFDPQSNDLINLPGVLSAIDQKILMNMIDQKILAEAERRRVLENLKILSYKGYKVFHLVSESFAVPESHGDFDPLSEDLKKIPGILTAYDQKRLKNKIDQQMDSEKTD